MRLLIIAIAAVFVMSSLAPAFAYDTVMKNYTGRNGSTVASDSLPAASGKATTLKGTHKTAVCYGNMTSVNDKVTMQGSIDGTTWYDCVDDAGAVVSWTKATLGTAKKWWDCFWQHRATYKKTALGNKPVTVDVTGR